MSPTRKAQTCWRKNFTWKNMRSCSKCHIQTLLFKFYMVCGACFWLRGLIVAHPSLLLMQSANVRSQFMMFPSQHLSLSEAAAVEVHFSATVFCHLVPKCSLLCQVLQSKGSFHPKVHGKLNNGERSTEAVCVFG